jgi:drug/metabolite transporter superfamily protein YnfA
VQPHALEVPVTRSTTILILLVAALLEAGGDALMRVGLHKNLIWQRLLFFVLAGAVLFAYGATVNAPPWDFGKLMGIYVVFFFLIAQLISWLVFKQTPTLPLCIGGALIIVGGIVVSAAKAQ